MVLTLSCRITTRKEEDGLKPMSDNQILKVNSGLIFKLIVYKRNSQLLDSARLELFQKLMIRLLPTIN